jgi:hypothetical protein
LDDETWLPLQNLRIAANAVTHLIERR